MNVNYTLLHTNQALFYNAEPLCEESRATFSQQQQKIKRVQKIVTHFWHFQSDAVLCHTKSFARKNKIYCVCLS
jgi:hypothetical protein